MKAPPPLAWLDGLCAFRVFADDSDPHETGYLDVLLSPKGFRVGWTGGPPDWCGTWKEFRDIVGLLAEREQIERDIQEARDERDMVTAQLGLKRRQLHEARRRLRIATSATRAAVAWRTTNPVPTGSKSGGE